MFWVANVKHCKNIRIVSYARQGQLLVAKKSPMLRDPVSYLEFKYSAGGFENKSEIPKLRCGCFYEAG